LSSSSAAATSARRAASVLAGLGGLGAQLLGVAAGRRLVGVVLAEQAHPLPGDPARGVEAVAQRLEAAPAVVCLGEQRCGRSGLVLEEGQPRAEVGEGLLRGRAARDEGGLVGDLLLERGGELDEVVGEQAQAGVARLGLDDRGLARGLGLAPERAELAADLAGEVLRRG
jgi:hypothetical protein